MSGQGRVRKRVSGIEAEVQVTAARGIAVARGCTSTTAYGPDTAFRWGPTVVKFGRRPWPAIRRCPPNFPVAETRVHGYCLWDAMRRW